MAYFGPDSHNLYQTQATSVSFAQSLLDSQNLYQTHKTLPSLTLLDLTSPDSRNLYLAHPTLSDSCLA